MARSKKGSRDTSGRGAAASSRPSKKRLRLKTSDDEEEEEVEVAKEERGEGGAVRRRRGGGEIDSLGKKTSKQSHFIGGEGIEEEGNSSRRGSIRGAAGCSRGGADPRVRSIEEVLFFCLTLADRCLHSSTCGPAIHPSNTLKLQCAFPSTR